MLVNNLIKNKDKNKNIQEDGVGIQSSLSQSLQESFSDVSGNLNNEKNPFIKEDNSNKLLEQKISINKNEHKKEVIMLQETLYINII